MQIGWNKKEESSDQVKEGPGNCQASDHADGGHQPPDCPVPRFDRGGSPAKAVRAEEFSFMLRDAFPAVVVGAGGTTGNGFPFRMDQTSLKSEFHREMLVTKELNQRLHRFRSAEFMF